MSRVFNGTTSDHLDGAASFASLPASGATFCIWLKPTSLVTQYVILSCGGQVGAPQSQQRFSLQLTATALVGAQEFDTGSSSGNSSAAVPDTTNWHLAVASFPSHSLRIGYMDGANRGSLGALKAATPTLPVNVISGSPYTYGTPYGGKAAHAAIWGAALTDPEILQLLTLRPYKIRPNDLIDYWPLTNGQVIEPSYGPGGNDLTVTGATFDASDNPVFASDFDFSLESTEYF